MNANLPIQYKFNEAAILNEVQAYINQTYTAHYAKDKFGRDKIQTIEKIFQNGWGLAFTLGNIMKYADRGELKGQFRKDILKIIHYGILALHAYDLENEIPSNALPPGALYLNEAES